MFSVCSHSDGCPFCACAFRGLISNRAATGSDPLVADIAEVFVGGRAEHVDDEAQLMQEVLAREQWLKWFRRRRRKHDSKKRKGAENV